MSKGVLAATIIGGAVVVAAILIYQSSQKASTAASSAVAGTANLNTLAGQASELLTSLGVKPE